jgi:hypothetical protein
MPGHEKSLLEYLRSENPVINGDMCRPGGNTKSTGDIWETPRKIEVWEDFEFNSLKSIYGGQLQEVLTSHFAFQDFSAIPQFPFREIHDENSLECLIVKWNHSMMADALSTAQSYLDNRLTHGKIHMVRGGQADYPASNSKLRPDWGGVQRPTTRISKPKNVLPGDTKLSKKWSSGLIKLGQVHFNHKKIDWLRPLTQVFSYCVRSNSRYGYVITDKELVVLRIRPGSETDSQSAVDIQGSFESSDPTPATRARSTGILEFQAIPWENDAIAADEECEVMTVNLALWWLHMMAAESSEIEEHYTPLPVAARTTGAIINSQNDSFTFSDMSGVGRRFADVVFEPQNSQSAPKASRRGRKRLRDDGINQKSRRGKKLRS